MSELPVVFSDQCDIDHLPMTEDGKLIYSELEGKVNILIAPGAKFIEPYLDDIVPPPKPILTNGDLEGAQRVLQLRRQIAEKVHARNRAIASRSKQQANLCHREERLKNESASLQSWQIMAIEADRDIYLADIAYYSEMIRQVEMEIYLNLAGLVNDIVTEETRTLTQRLFSWVKTLRQN